VGYSSKVTSSYRHLVGRELEEHVAGAYELLGYDARIVEAGARRSIDVVAEKGDVRVGILCSNTDALVDSDEVREAADAARRIQNCNHVTIIAIGGFTTAARKRARKDGVQIFDDATWPQFLFRALRRDRWAERGVKVPKNAVAPRPPQRAGQPRQDTWETRDAKHRPEGASPYATVALGILLIGAVVAGLQIHRLRPALFALPRTANAYVPQFGTAVDETNRQVLPAKTTAQLHEAAEAHAASAAAAAAPAAAPGAQTTAPPDASTSVDQSSGSTTSCQPDGDPVLVSQAPLQSTDTDQSLHGTAGVRVDVSASGVVTGVTLTESSGNRQYDWAAQNAARNSTYHAAISNCAPADGSVELTF
jgi:TonB family protein